MTTEKKVSLNSLAMEGCKDDDECTDKCREVAKEALQAALGASGGNSARVMIGLSMAACSYAVTLKIERDEFLAAIGETYDQYAEALAAVMEQLGVEGAFNTLRQHSGLHPAVLQPNAQQTLEEAAERLNSLADELEALRKAGRTKH